MTKGFIFTVDAALASTLAVLLLVVATNLNTVNSGPYFGKLQLASIGNDFLAVLELNNTFDSYVTMSESNAANDLQSHLTTLPPNYCANVTVYAYDYSSGNFVLDNTHSFSVVKTGCAAPSESVNVKRVFITFDPEKYGKVEMALWLK